MNHRALDRALSTRVTDEVTTDQQKAELSHWFTELQNRICAALEVFEKEITFGREPWKRP